MRRLIVKAIEDRLRAIVREELARHDRDNTTALRFDMDDPRITWSPDLAPDPVPFYRRF